MRKLVLAISMSVDGFVAGPDGELDWVIRSFDDEMEKSIVETYTGMGTILLGRGAYQDMSQTWPDSPEDIAPLMNTLPKVVFSRTLESTDWTNSRVCAGDLAEEVWRLKEQLGRDIIAPGGARFARSLCRLGLVDEYRLMIHPVALGSGQPLFAEVPEPADLDLASCRQFSTGAMLCVYHPT